MFLLQTLGSLLEKVRVKQLVGCKPLDAFSSLDQVPGIPSDRGLFLMILDHQGVLPANIPSAEQPEDKSSVVGKEPWGV